MEEVTHHVDFSLCGDVVVCRKFRTVSQGSARHAMLSFSEHSVKLDQKKGRWLKRLD